MEPRPPASCGSAALKALLPDEGGEGESLGVGVYAGSRGGLGECLEGLSAPVSWC